MSKYQVNSIGYYGPFGGAYIPEMLYPNVEELQQQYLDIMADPSFQQEFEQLLRDYVGRPSPYIRPTDFRKNTKPTSTSSART